MNAVRIYRWQDKEGRGPYRPGLSLYWKEADHEQRNPAMHAEFGVDIYANLAAGQHYGCGFRSPEQMHRWFTADEQQRMRVLGYEFGSMQVDRIVAESDRQLVFARRRPLRHGFITEAAAS